MSPSFRFGFITVSRLLEPVLSENNVTSPPWLWMAWRYDYVSTRKILETPELKGYEASVFRSCGGLL